MSTELINLVIRPKMPMEDYEFPKSGSFQLTTALKSVILN